MSAPTLTCRFSIEAPLDEIGELRAAAWGPLLGHSRAEERFGITDDDHRAWHLVTRIDGIAVAAGRLIRCPSHDDLPETLSFGPWIGAMAPPMGIASRLAVHPDHQGQGLGEQIIIRRLEVARRIELNQVWGETRTDHVHGLERHGYRVLGQSTDASVPGTWHIMCAALNEVGAAPLGDASLSPQ